MEIDLQAPLIAQNEIVINAPINLVWHIQSDINNWPNWQKDITYANLEGKLAKGTIFKWKAIGMSITSELQEVSENKSIGWSGRSIGMYAIHMWEFEKQGDKTKVTTKESLSGWIPLVLKILKPDFLKKALYQSMLTLKNQAEKTNNS